jgi:hypothetical protein
VNNKYYRKWGIKNISFLARPQDVGPFEFVAQVKNSNGHFINIFRVREITPQQRKQLLKREGKP